MQPHRDVQGARDGRGGPGGPIAGCGIPCRPDRRERGGRPRSLRRRVRARGRDPHDPGRATGGGTGIAGIWKALQELRELGWYEGPWPRIGLVQAEGCAPLVRAWKDGRETAEPWADPRTRAAGLRVPATLADRIVLRALRETKGVGVTVSEEAMTLAAANLAALEGVSACLEGAATLAGLRRLYDEGVIAPEDRVVLVNTGTERGDDRTPPASIPTVGSAEEAVRNLGLTPPASWLPRGPASHPAGFSS